MPQTRVCPFQEWRVRKPRCAQKPQLQCLLRQGSLGPLTGQRHVLCATLPSSYCSFLLVSGALQEASSSSLFVDSSTRNWWWLPRTKWAPSACLLVSAVIYHITKPTYTHALTSRSSNDSRSRMAEYITEPCTSVTLGQAWS